MAVMTGGTQLVEGSHLTAQNKHGRLVYVLYCYSLFTLTQSILNLRNFVVNLALSRLCTFWGALSAETYWRGAQKHFSQPGPPPLGRSEKPKSWKSKNGQADY